jgi:hypothetical protein
MPAGLLQAADAACTAEPCSGSGLAGSKRSRCGGDADAAADDDRADAGAGVDLGDLGQPDSIKQQQQQPTAHPHKQAKQKDLAQSWAAAAAAGGGTSRPTQAGQQSRLGRMSQADQQQQHGPGYSRKPLTLDSGLFDNVGDVFTGARHDGGRHTDLTQVRQLIGGWVALGSNLFAKGAQQVDALPASALCEWCQ